MRWRRDCTPAEQVLMDHLEALGWGEQEMADVLNRSLWGPGHAARARAWRTGERTRALMRTADLQCRESLAKLLQPISDAEWAEMEPKVLPNIEAAARIIRGGER